MHLRTHSNSMDMDLCRYVRHIQTLSWTVVVPARRLQGTVAGSNVDMSVCRPVSLYERVNKPVWFTIALALCPNAPGRSDRQHTSDRWVGCPGTAQRCGFFEKLWYCDGNREGKPIFIDYRLSICRDVFAMEDGGRWQWAFILWNKRPNAVTGDAASSRFAEPARQ